MRDQYKKNARIRIHPSVIQQLGESLITDDVQALIELIKNSYDADASYVKIKIIAPNDNTNSLGEIIIEDDGIGMGAKQIIAGWLYISNRQKQKQKQKQKLTKKGRTPLGDKGLGRLGIQKLGNYFEMVTKSAINPAYKVQINWSDFKKKDRLEEVPVAIERIPEFNKVGTTIKITELINPQIWTKESSQNRLIYEFSKMISPYIKIRKFLIYLEINGKEIELVSISDKIRNIASLTYDISFNGEKISVSAKISKEWLTSKLTDISEKKQYDSIIHYAGFQEYIKQFPNSTQYNITPLDIDNNEWLFAYGYEANLSDLDKVEYLESTLFNNREIANPGPFESEIDYFDFTQKNNVSNIFNKQQDYKEAIKALDGIRVFRDGFGVRTGEDWLRLGSANTSKTYYSLRPENTHGYIAISASYNSVLEETTSREQFKDTPYYRNFFLILQNFINFTDITNNFFGRKWVEYRKIQQEKLAAAKLGDTSNIRKVIQNKTENIKEQQSEIKNFQVELTSKSLESISIITNVANNIENGIFLDHNKNELSRTLLELERLLQEAQSYIPKLDQQLEELNQLNQFAEVIENRFITINEQMSDIFETASLGLVAESLSHEIYNVTDRMLLRTKQVQEKISSDNIPLLAYTEYIKTTALGLKKQISYIDPALKYVKDQKQTINLNAFFKEFIESNNERQISSKICMKLIESNNSDLVIYYNKGKLIQIFDNLVNNSIYWLCQNNPLLKEIYINLDNNYNIIVWDTARGIDPSVENILFEPFISTKYDTTTKTKGRGLGLYIIKQLLQYDNCSIELLSDKNEYNRFYKFKINMLRVKNG